MGDTKKRVNRNPQPKLNPERLMGPRGIQTLEDLFSDCRSELDCPDLGRSPTLPLTEQNIKERLQLGRAEVEEEEDLLSVRVEDPHKVGEQGATNWRLSMRDILESTCQVEIKKLLWQQPRKLWPGCVCGQRC